MNNICIFCNSKAEPYKPISGLYRSCKFCSDILNLEVWWHNQVPDQYIYFSTDNGLYGRYHTETQELELNDGTRLIIPQGKVITKLKTILLLS